jgi:hypothetical protein
MLACFAFLINLGLLLCWHVTSALHIGAGHENGAQQLQNTQLESNGVTDYGNWYVISPKCHFSNVAAASILSPFPTGLQWAQSCNTGLYNLCAGAARTTADFRTAAPTRQHAPAARCWQGKRPMSY